MVPVEIAAFGWLGACVVALALVLAVQLLAPPASGAARTVMLIVLIAVVLVGVYVIATTRMP